jgi:hypothetical protein
MAANKVLLVEGRDDEHVLYHLLAHHQVTKAFEIKNKGGVTNLIETLDVEVLASGLERLGIVVDADTDLAARWQSVRNKLLASGYDVPEKPVEGGTIIEHNEQPTVGIWVMPDNALIGFLENFVSFLIPADDTLWVKTVECINQIPLEERLFPEGHLVKAQIHTWLAWQAEPGTPLGLAITKKYLDADAPQARQLIDWLRHLFNI